MEPEPIFGEPVLRVADALVIADVHIGVEKKLIHAGVSVPSMVDDHLERLSSLAEAHASGALIVLGDLKHTIAYATQWERREVPRFLDGALRVFSKVHVVPGNHDAGMGDIIPDGVVLHGAGGWADGGCGYAHGHRWPSKAAMAERTLVVGHNHPVVAFVDTLGRATRQRCWLRAPFRDGHPRYPRLPAELIKMPAFNPLLGGAPVNAESPKLRGPLMRPDVVDIDAAKVFLEDGAFLGSVGDLPAAPAKRPPRGRKDDDQAK